MSIFVKATVLSLGLVAGIAVGAQAQTNSPYPGPKAGSIHSVPNMTAQTAVLPPSTAYPGPALGGGGAYQSQQFQKPAGYDQDPGMKPYDKGYGPRPN